LGEFPDDLHVLQGLAVDDFPSDSSERPVSEGILRGVFQNFNPLCGRNPIENGS